MRRRGRLSGSKVEIPPARLSQKDLFSRAGRLFTREEIHAFNRANEAVLDLYGLRLTACRRVTLRDPWRQPLGTLETDHRDHLIATATLASLAVTATGRGALLDMAPEARAAAKETVKERNDRAATCAMAEGIFALGEAMRNAVCEIAIGEGVRLKPGEKGGNPTLYGGMTFGDPEVAALTREQREAKGARTYSMAVDAVEGTTKSTIADVSSGTLFYITESEIRRVPDVYFNKCQLYDVNGVDVNTDLRRIGEAVADSRGTDEINAFAMTRPRHPLDEMLDYGVNVRTDTDGDAFPAVASGLQWGVFADNQRPLDGVWGNIGGAAEVVASASAGHYLGVHSSVRFCAKKIDSWSRRYDFGPGEEDRIRSLGFECGKIYRTKDLVPGVDDKDGVFVAAAITDIAHVPLLDAAFWGANCAEVSVILVGASGAADLYRLTFAFRNDARSTAESLTPILETILARPESEMRQAVREALGSPSGSRRLRHEFATSFYSHFAERAGRFRLDMESAEAVESPQAVALIRAITDAAGDWFD